MQHDIPGAAYKLLRNVHINYHKMHIRPSPHGNLHIIIQNHESTSRSETQFVDTVLLRIKRRSSFRRIRIAKICSVGIDLHACSYELAKYGRVAPRCRTAWPLCWPQTALHQQQSSYFLCKTESTPEVGGLTQALLSRF